jgi:DNA-binding transcriptional regulator YhcF (GntR family)
MNDMDFNNFNTPTPKKERNADMALAAEQMKSMVVELILAGFSRAEALELTSSYYAKISASMMKKNKGDTNDI